MYCSKPISSVSGNVVGKMLVALQDARKSFREAQAKMHSCRQAFHNAQAAGDSAGQRHYASQLEYWQHKALQEKQRAHKKIFTKK